MLPSVLTWVELQKSMLNRTSNNQISHVVIYTEDTKQFSPQKQKVETLVKATRKY